MENPNQKYEFNNRFYKTISAMKRAETILKKAQAKNAKRLAYLQKIGQEKFKEINERRKTTNTFGKYEMPNYVPNNKPIQKSKEERIKKYDEIYENKNKNNTTKIRTVNKAVFAEDKFISRSVKTSLKNAFINIRLTNENFMEEKTFEQMNRIYNRTEGIGININERLRIIEN